MSEDSVNERLAKVVYGIASLGDTDVSKSLGIQKMPEGYALMMNRDESHFYWLRYDSVQSDVHWDRWAIFSAAKRNKEYHDKLDDAA